MIDLEIRKQVAIEVMGWKEATNNWTAPWYCPNKPFKNTKPRSDGYDKKQSFADMKHIAASSPANAIALIESKQALEAENARLAKKYANRLNLLLDIRAQLRTQETLEDHTWHSVQFLENYENANKALKEQR